MDNNMEKEELLEQEQPAADEQPEVVEAPVEESVIAEVAEEATEQTTDEASEEVVTEEMPEYVPEQKKGSNAWKWIVGISCVLVLSAAVAIAVLFGSGVFGSGETTAETTGPDQTGESLPMNFTSYTVTDEVAAGMANEVVAQVGDSKLTNGMLQIFYRAEVYNFLNQYGYYLSMFGLDPAKPLDQQPFYADQTISWQQYFLDNAINNWRSYAVLNEIAAAEGYELTQKAKDDIANAEATLQKDAVNGGYGSLDEMASTEAGAGATAQSFIDYQKMLYASLDFFDTKYASMTPTADEIAARYAEKEEAYVSQGITKGGIRVDVRHILVKVGTTTDEEGQAVSTDADWESCQVKAQLILDQWKAGDATEESFGTLAGQITEDGGSKATGGLYEGVVDGDMVPEFNDWIMDESRVPGDTGLVKTQFGYHVMYFCDSEEIPTEEQKWYTTVMQELLSERFDAFFMEGEAKYPLKSEYSKMGLTEVPLT